MTTLVGLLGSPLAVALVGLIGVALTYLATRQKTRADEKALYYQSVLTELKSLRDAEQLNTTRVKDMMADLAQAKEDILDCYRERNELALRVSALQQQVDSFQRRHRDDHHERAGGEGR